MFYVPKTENSGRCRRQAPTMKGFPVVYGNADWCGEHKIGSNPVRDGKEKPLTSPCFDQPLEFKSVPGEILIKTEEDFKKEALEGKAKIKEEINEELWHIGDKATIPDRTTREGTIQSSIVVIKELLEKL